MGARMNSTLGDAWLAAHEHEHDWSTCPKTRNVLGCKSYSLGDASVLSKKPLQQSWWSGWGGHFRVETYRKNTSESDGNKCKQMRCKRSEMCWGLSCPTKGRPHIDTNWRWDDGCQTSLLVALHKDSPTCRRYEARSEKFGYIQMSLDEGSMARFNFARVLHCGQQ